MKERKSKGKAKKEKSMLEDLLEGMAAGYLFEELTAESTLEKMQITADRVIEEMMGSADTDRIIEEIIAGYHIPEDAITDDNEVIK